MFFGSPTTSVWHHVVTKPIVTCLWYNVPMCCILYTAKSDSGPLKFVAGPGAKTRLGPLKLEQAVRLQLRGESNQSLYHLNRWYKSDNKQNCIDAKGDGY